MSTHNLCFYGEMTKIYLSIIKLPPSLGHCELNLHVTIVELGPVPRKTVL